VFVCVHLWFHAALFSVGPAGFFLARLVFDGITVKTALRTFWLVLAAGLLALAVVRPGVASDADLRKLVDQIREEVRPDDAMERMRRMWEIERWFTFPKFHEDARYIEQTLRGIGLSEVEKIDAPADGITQNGFWTMPLAWDVEDARLEILEPRVGGEQRVLADYRQVPASLGMWSGPTPAEGVSAEIVDVRDSASLDGFDLQGKLALTSRNPASLKAALVEKKALGAINAFSENTDLEDGRQWINAWGDAGWAFTKGSTPLLSFSISPKQARMLRELLAKGEPVRVRAMVRSRYYEDSYPYVTALLPGNGETREEVLALGHIAEQGAQDNSTGVAAIVEGMAALHRLIESGKLPRPRRSIRMLAMGELYSSLHYITSNKERIGHTIGAICLDTPAGFYHLAGTEYTFYLNPHTAKSYSDALILKIAEAYFPRLQPKRPWHWSEYSAGTDNYLGDPTINVPTVWPYASSGVQTHHNSEDTPADVDPRSLRDLSVVTAAYLYALASAGELEAIWLAEAGLNHGYEQVLGAYEKAFERLVSAEKGSKLGQELYRGQEDLKYRAAREKEAVGSVVRLVPELQREPLQRSIAPLLGRLDAFEKEQSRRLAEAADRRGRDLRVAEAIVPQAPPPDPQMQAAERIVVKRKRAGSIPLDDLKESEREGYPAAGWWGHPVSALFWCDGKRNLAEVIRLTEHELGPTDFDFTGYFRFLRKHGYVEFVE
jgi:hypothetical protein